MIRKSLKQNILLAVSAAVIPFMVAGTCTMASYACEAEIVEEKDISMENGMARSPIIERRYKMVDGVLYWRLYNYSDGYWIGEWEPVPIKEP